MRKLSIKLRHGLLCCFLFIMPVGIPVDSDNSGELTLGLHGGGGQVLSVIRGCEGKELASEKSTFKDVAATLQVSFQLDPSWATVVGIRSGYLHSNATFPIYNNPDLYGDLDLDDEYKAEVSYKYFNPYFAMEGTKAGLGLGYVFGEVPFQFAEVDDYLTVSGHFRLGRYDKTFLLVSLNENLPLASGGGYWNMGLGYTPGRSVRMFTGATWGFYDGGGVVQQVSIPLSKRFEFDLSLRLFSEVGIAAGLRYNIPLR